ncbi:hypothetical protein EDC04DRAFT_2757858 [Pisolithus marmoratus]|nr:hypothetical protein EDC04DRAFT_2757858 [Pisolithus marmoratus]
MAYQGFLGSEGSRFVGQELTDIHYTGWRGHPGIIPIRQHSIVLAYGLWFLYPEWMPGNAWVPFHPHVPAMHVMDLGPVLPPGMPPPPPLHLLPVAFLLGGQALRIGYAVPWFHDLDIFQMDFRRIRRRMHYYQHRRRQAHHVTPNMIPNGRHYSFNTLRYGTQINEYRRAHR